jgi:glc operon protein GlcG
MSFYRETRALTHQGALAALAAAIAKAEAMAVPQVIVIVDASGVLLATLRMDGAKYLSIQTATAKARTAASTNRPTGGLSFETGIAAGVATQGGLTLLPGGLPIRFGGALAGAIGVGSGTGEEDVEVARAALSAIGADAV